VISKRDLSQVPGVELNDENFKVAIKLQYDKKKLLGEDFDSKYID
jgi:hypothetical protein